MEPMQGSEKYKLQAQIRASHEKRLILALLRYGPMSRTDLANKLKVSLTSISALSERLLRAGWIVRSGAPNNAEVGRPAERLSLREDALCVPVVSARRGHLSIAMYDMCLNRIQSDSFPYPEDFVASGHAPQFAGFPVVEARRFASFVADCLSSMPGNDASRASGVLLSMPGNFLQPEAYFTSAPLNFAIRGEFEKELQEIIRLPVTLGNDSDFFAYAQKSVPGEDDSFVFVNINEGVGAGIIHRGHIFRSGASHAAEIGHQSIDANGIACRCGGRGCLERYISFSAIAEQVGKHWGRPASMSEVFSACKAGDAAVLQVLEDVASKLAFALSNMLAIFESELILVGGGVEVFGEPFLSSLRRRMGKEPVRYKARRIPIQYARSSQADDRVGAASYFIEEIWRVPQG